MQQTNAFYEIELPGHPGATLGGYNKEELTTTAQQLYPEATVEEA